MDTQLDLFSQNTFTLEELFEAYRSCRKNKRNTVNATAFEIHYEEITNGSYTPGPSLAFIVE